MRITGAAVGLAVVAMGGGLAGCGGSGSSTGSTGARPPSGGLSRSELAAKAQAQCLAGKGRAPLVLPADAPRTAVVAAIDKALRQAEKETRYVQSLRPAADVASDWHAFVSAMVAIDQEFAEIRQRLASNQPLRQADGKVFLATVQRLGDASGRIGFTCANR